MQEEIDVINIEASFAWQFWACNLIFFIRRRCGDNILEIHPDVL